MVKIRLKRLGRKKRPFYRVVVTDIRNRRDGKPIAELGFYNPLTKELKLDKAEAQAWVGKGAIPSDTVKKLIESAPESGEVIRLEVIRKEKLSKKAQAKKEAEAQLPAEPPAEKPVEEEAPAEETVSETTSVTEPATEEEKPAEAEA